MYTFLAPDREFTVYIRAEGGASRVWRAYSPELMTTGWGKTEAQAVSHLVGVARRVRYAQACTSVPKFAHRTALRLSPGFGKYRVARAGSFVWRGEDAQIEVMVSTSRYTYEPWAVAIAWDGAAVYATGETRTDAIRSAVGILKMVAYYREFSAL